MSKDRRASLFPVVDLDDWTRGEREPGGDEEKRWFTPPDTHALEGRWLFKPRTVKSLALSKAALERGDSPAPLIGGEPWAEKISYEIARLLGLPAARTMLASVTRLRVGEHLLGSMSCDMRPQNWSWAAGASLLSELDPLHFDSDSCEGHTLDAIRAVLAGIHPHADTFQEWSAFDLFSGYLLFDAWIANTDRHAHNWGVLSDEDGVVFLGPTFDHGSAFGSRQGESKIAEIVEAKRLPEWCGRGITKRFDAGTKFNLVEFAATALTQASTDARHHWARKLAAIDMDDCESIVASCPDLSDSTRTFVITVLDTNRRRLLDVVH